MRVGNGVWTPQMQRMEKPILVIVESRFGACTSDETFLFANVHIRCMR